MNVTNKYLKASIAEIANFFKNGTSPPEDMYLNLILELKVSNLLLPIVFDGKNITFPHIEVDDGTKLLPLFTSADELRRYSGEFESISNEIAYYINIVDDLGIDGIIIDIQSDEFCIERKLLDKIPLSQEHGHARALEPSQLRDIALGEKNYELKKFIRSESGFNDFDGISRILKDCNLLNVVVSEDDLSRFAHDGIIGRDEADTFTLYTTKSGREHYGAVYTDVDAICEFHDTLDYFYYAQLTNKYTVFNFILSNDMDGLVINPGTDEYYVPRQVLLRLLDDGLYDGRMENATAYAFQIE